jgi:hypothetical protein
LHHKWIPWDCSFGITLFEKERERKSTVILHIAVENGHENKVF